MVEIVVGATFGDEGKGQVVHALCCDYIRECNDHPLVIRYSGGQQAGHTVITSHGTKHIFSCFGSGTLANCPIFWNENCVMDPIQWKFEKNLLITKMGRFRIPTQYFHSLVEITTPMMSF